MGDMADYALDQVLDMEDHRSTYWAGEMCDGEAYDAGIIDEMGGYNGPSTYTRGTGNRTCAHCGKTGLHWIHNGTKWRLAEAAGGYHQCEQRKPPVHTGAGTIPARFSGLISELEKRLGEVDKLSSTPPETTLLKRLDALLRTNGY